ncbi:MAG TPA: ATP synthase F0 subunit B [Treponema sp.]|nr:ATP synthase F0 subunit B [Treponema sp.]
MENSSLISPNLVTFVLTIVNVGVLCLLLRAILFKPVTKFMEERAKKIQDTIDQAEKDKSEAQQLLDEYKNQLKNAEVEAEGIIKAARENAEREAAHIISEGKDAAETALANARKQIETEREAALAKFRADAVMLVLAASARLIGREIQQDDSRHFVNMLLDELSRARAGAAQEGNGSW